MPTTTTKRKVYDGSTMPKNRARNRTVALRNARICNAVLDGARQIDVAAKYGLTSGRVCQIVSNPRSTDY